MTDPVKVEIVGPVMTNSDNPWRTQGDYREEQIEERERHAMFKEQHRLIQEQHRLLARSLRWNIALVIATIVMAIATVVTVVYPRDERSHKISSQPEQTSPPQANPSPNSTK